MFVKHALLLSLVMSLCGLACQPQASETDQAVSPPRVFLIMVDDLRPTLGCYGTPMVQSPQIDALAEDALVFDRAYANVPVCGASRASLLSGLRPSRQRFVSYSSQVETDAPDAVTLPAYLKANGYQTFSMGKVFHHADDSKAGWSEPPYRGPKATNKDYVRQENIDRAKSHPRKRAVSFEAIDTTDEAYLDGKLAAYARQKLDDPRLQDQPLFMALGFYKPHLPFNAPQQYWDLYDRAALPFPANYHPPQGAPQASLHQFDELRSYTDIPDDQEPLDSALARQNIHGYYACVSYTDAQVGKFIQGLKEKGWYDNSLIILAGDHGWFLGEHSLWAKHANYRDALRTALMVKLPQNEKKGLSQLPVELVELYPTLLDIVGLTPPSHLHAQSFLPLLDGAHEAGKEVYCRYQEGETLIQGPYAYTEYVDDAEQVYARMLYDHRTDPGENHNVVESSEATLVKGFSKKLQTYRDAYDQPSP